MTIKITCECKHRFKVADEHAGRRARCPLCRKVIRIPSVLPAAVGLAKTTTPPLPVLVEPAQVDSNGWEVLLFPDESHNPSFAPPTSEPSQAFTTQLQELSKMRLRVERLYPLAQPQAAVGFLVAIILFAGFLAAATQLDRNSHGFGAILVGGVVTCSVAVLSSIILPLAWGRPRYAAAQRQLLTRRESFARQYNIPSAENISAVEQTFPLSPSAAIPPLCIGCGSPFASDFISIPIPTLTRRRIEIIQASLPYLCAAVAVFCGVRFYGAGFYGVGRAAMVGTLLGCVIGAMVSGITTFLRNMLGRPFGVYACSVCLSRLAAHQGIVKKANAIVVGPPATNPLFSLSLARKRTMITPASELFGTAFSCLNRVSARPEPSWPSDVASMKEPRQAAAPLTSVVSSRVGSNRCSSCGAEVSRAELTCHQCGFDLLGALDPDSVARPPKRRKPSAWTRSEVQQLSDGATGSLIRGLISLGLVIVSVILGGYLSIARPNNEYLAIGLLFGTIVLPFVALAFGSFAVVKGIRALRLRSDGPERRGRVAAISGLVTGGLSIVLVFGLLGITCILVMNARELARSKADQVISAQRAALNSDQPVNESDEPVKGSEAFVKEFEEPVKGSDERVTLPDVQKTPSSHPRDYFPSETAARWTYSVTYGAEVGFADFKKVAWPIEDGTSEVYSMRSVTSHPAGDAPVSGGETQQEQRRCTLELQVKGPAGKQGPLQYPKGVELTVVRDEANVFDNCNNLYWAIDDSNGPPVIHNTFPVIQNGFQVIQVVTYAADRMPGTSPIPGFGSRARGDGSAMRYLFVGTQPGISVTLGDAPDSLGFAGPVNNIVGYEGIESLHFQRLVTAAEKKAGEKASTFEESFTVDTWYGRDIGLLRLEQRIDGELSMSWALESYTPGEGSKARSFVRSVSKASETP